MDVLRKYGFLRNKNPPPMEFCKATYKAIPAMSAENVYSLTDLFEEARYSSHVLGEPHRQNAQMALSTVLQEIDELQEFPERDSYIADED